jgi:hypothetical protein
MIAIAIARCQVKYCNVDKSFPTGMGSDLMRLAIACSFALVSSAAHAAFTDFSDYTQAQEFALGATFSSQGVAFKAVNWLGITNSVQVSASPTTAGLYVGPGVEFLLPPNIQEVSLRYHDGAAGRIAINGVEPASYPGQGTIPSQAGFSYLNNASLAGVSMSTTVLRQDIHGSKSTITLEEGILHLRGPINSLTIAGLELFIDDVLIRVPEPSAAALLMTGSAIAVAARRRPHRRLRLRVVR